MPDTSLEDQPIQPTVDAMGFPLPMATIDRDRVAALTPILDLTAGNMVNDPGIEAENAAAASTILKVEDVGQCVLWPKYTKGASTKLVLRVYFGRVKADLEGGGVPAQQISTSTTAGVSTINHHTYEYTMPSGTVKKIPIAIPVDGYGWMKVYAYAEGADVTAAACRIEATRSPSGQA